MGLAICQPAVLGYVLEYHDIVLYSIRVPLVLSIATRVLSTMVRTCMYVHGVAANGIAAIKGERTRASFRALYR